MLQHIYSLYLQYESKATTWLYISEFSAIKVSHIRDQCKVNPSIRTYFFLALPESFSVQNLAFGSLILQTIVFLQRRGDKI